MCMHGIFYFNQMPEPLKDFLEELQHELLVNYFEEFLNPRAVVS